VQAPGSLDRLAQAVRFDGLWWRRLAHLGAVHGPEWLKRRSPPLVAAVLFALVRERRTGTVRNLERVLNTDRWTAGWAALRTFAEFAYCTSEAMEHCAGRAVRLDRPAEDPVANALREGRGLVVVTGHFGSWSIGAQALSGLDRPVNVVMAREANATAQEFVRAAYEQAGVRVIFGDESVFSSLGLIRALRRNEIVALQLDRMVGSAGARLLPFLGTRAPFPSGPFVLARLADAPLIPVFVPRLGTRHYRLHIGQGVAVPREARDARVLEGVMLEIVRQLEDMVRRHPSQWFQFSPFWPEAHGHDQGTALGDGSASLSRTRSA
jgi:lauroyl/myristoyl acyltransferase